MKIVARRGSAMLAVALGTALAVSAGTAAAVPAADQRGGSIAAKVGAGQDQVVAQQKPDRPDPGKSKPLRLIRDVLAKAAPDECFNGIGEPYPQGTVQNGELVCPEGQPKVNQAYVWGLAESQDGDLWFGTGPNIHCLVFSTYLGNTAPNQTDSWVCEGEASYYRTMFPNLPPELGDFRPPDIFVYDQEQGTLTRLNDHVVAQDRARLFSTVGIRSAGAIGDRVFFAGPNLSETGGVNVFVFATDGSYVGSETLPGFSNIRKWVEVGGALYTGVRAGNGGAVLKYVGSTPADPFQYEVVGTMTSEPAELAEHDGRLFVSTWPAEGPASLWMSPLLGDDGQLSTSDAGGWQQVWNVADYEPDRVTAATYGGGALASFGGQLYWGTMHVPFTSTLAHIQAYGEPADTSAAVAAVLGTHRAISIFRGDDFGTGDEQVELLYGETQLSVYDGVTSTWSRKPNNMGTQPLYGTSGFGNPFNNYTWTMAVFGGSLYVGTMDWSYLLAEGGQGLLEEYALPIQSLLPLVAGEFGADLWRFPSGDERAVAQSLDGVGNYTSYGIRTMAADANALYLGMANPMNLLTDRTDDVPEGGWELLRLRPKR